MDMTTVGNAGWIGHSGPDSEAIQKFYRDVVGWTIVDLPMKDGSAHPGIMVGDAPIGGFSSEPEEAGIWTVYITVTDVDGKVEAARQAGAQVLCEPMDMPGVGRMATLVDPQGARFALITYESMMEG